MFPKQNIEFRKPIPKILSKLKQLLKFKKWEQLFYNAGNDVIVAVFVLPPAIE